jgi:diguanylate cyclase (GGDEF)-like protein/PAS domain S-box-containing protein
MFAKLKQWYLETKFRYEEEQRVARILLIIVLVSLAALLATFLAGLSWGDWLTAVAALIGIALQAVPLYLLARGDLRTCSLATSLIVLIETTAIATIGAGIHDLAIIVYPLILVMASLLDRRNFIVIFILVILAVSWLVFGAANHIFTPTVYPSVIWTDLLVVVTILSGAALAVNSMARNIWEGLSQARIEIAERKRVENALRESEEKYRRDFNNVSDVIYSFDLELKIINISPSVEKILGYAPSEVIGKTFPELNVLAPEYLELALSDTLKVLSGEKVKSAYEFLTKDGTRVFGEIFGSPLLSKDGQIIGLVAVARDITDQRQAEEMQKRRTRELEALYETTLDVITEHDLSTLLHAILKRAVTLVDTHMGGLYLVRPDDGMLELVTTQNVPENYIGSILAPGEGLSGRVAQTGQPLIIPDYLQWNDRVRAYDSTPFHRTLGIPLKVSDRTIGVITLMDDQRTGSYSDEEIRLVSLFANQAAIAIENARLYANVERELEVRKQAEEDLKRAHEDLQTHVIEVEKLQSELREQALRDPLTGLYNRRYLAEMLEHELARVQREKKPMSVIVTDIDHFKNINDNYGHQVGDEFLKRIADLIGNHTRSSDIACRYGGEEFLLVMPGTTVKSAARRAEELRLACTQIQVPHENIKLSVTLSFGVASYPSHGQGAEEIVIKADKALYKSKRSGRNRVTVWDKPKGRKLQ